MSEPQATPPIDKSAWGPGPWQDEPDRVEWEHAGHPCLMLRSADLGQWCGYAAVPPGHPWHGASANTLDPDVHGGLTFAGACQGHICHVPKPGEPADVWWLGFDCGHAFDLAPGLAAMLGRAAREAMMRDTYRTLAYVRAEVEGLAEQAAEAAR